MDRYKAIMQAEKIHAVLQSISRNNAELNKNSFSISKETLQELVSGSEYVKQCLLALIETEDGMLG